MNTLVLLNDVRDGMAVVVLLEIGVIVYLVWKLNRFWRRPHADQGR